MFYKKSNERLTLKIIYVLLETPGQESLTKPFTKRGPCRTGLYPIIVIVGFLYK